MPYNAKLDPYTNLPTDSTKPITSGTRITDVAANGGDFTAFGGVYPKALRVYVPVGVGGPHITVLGAGNDDGDTPVGLTLNEGETIIDWIRVRRVTNIAPTVVVQRIDDMGY